MVIQKTQWRRNIQSKDYEFYTKQAVRRRIRKALQVYIAVIVLLLLLLLFVYFVVLVVTNFIQGIYIYYPRNKPFCRVYNITAILWL